MNQKMRLLKRLSQLTNRRSLVGSSHYKPLLQLTKVIDLIRSISDPEHPLTLEQLRVVSAEQIFLGTNTVMVEFTPTVPHCGMSTIIGVYLWYKYVMFL
jgi:metal-sulfur cluster biosynthetic enzyme